MSDVRMYVHAVWAVKKRYPLLEESKRTELFVHILETAKEKNIQIKAINGHDDHVHCLIKLGSVQSISEVTQHLKGESSCWANEKNLFEKRLTWAKGYYARSVDEHNIYIVKKYIAGQHKHKNPPDGFREGQVKDYLDRIAGNGTNKDNQRQAGNSTDKHV